MRLREAERFSDEACRLLIVVSKRDWIAPNWARWVLMVESALSMIRMAKVALLTVVRSTTLTVELDEPEEVAPFAKLPAALAEMLKPVEESSVTVPRTLAKLPGAAPEATEIDEPVVLTPAEFTASVVSTTLPAPEVLPITISAPLED